MDLLERSHAKRIFVTKRGDTYVVTMVENGMVGNHKRVFSVENARSQSRKMLGDS